ncbi:hypothetical protein EVG20_g3489 [Dentipellis fragilis]|uniref:Uncharacterized protein n=1 Tax=Dentipellis fragilis TaxID=205917 RepID=A0A4Y9Z462_9AGAM|nr:hypothetical protein EVG20_g3489 [Dentipellis fragilis]
MPPVRTLFDAPPLRLAQLMRLESSMAAALKLSLESPYKDDSGNPIPVVLDILPDGAHVFEPQVSAGAKLGDNLRRLFLERGLDFFEQDADRRRNNALTSDTTDSTADTDGAHVKEDRDSKPMTFEELLKMRTELLPQLQ